MATRKPGKNRAKQAAKQRVVKRKVAKKKFVRKKAAARRPARKKAAKRPAARPARRSAPPAPRPVDRRGLITHTELASSDPSATQAWCERVLGWKFMEPMPTPTGPYLMWRFANDTGGGIRGNNPPEMPGAIPYCEVESIHETFSAALASGASEMLGPQELPGGMGWIAVVAAPGGVAFGFWAAK